MIAAQESSTRPKLYEEVAEQIHRLIRQGTLRPGDRIPSVRKLSQQQRVSITTILEAYRLLESEGLIEARPQSGYFVSAPFPDAAAEPSTSRPAPDPTQVSSGEIVMMVLRDTRNRNLIQLGAAVPPEELLPMEKLNRALARVSRQEGAHGALYDIPPGCKELRVQVARRMVEAGCSLRPDEIVTTFGCQEAVTLCLRAVCRPGDTVAIESPTFYGILQAIEALGLRALELPTHPRHGLGLEALRFALGEHRVSAVLVTNFNNPLGGMMPPEKQQELVELLAAREIPLIEDDIYGDLCFSARRPPAARSFDRKGLVMLCSSFSKTLTPGYRVGWCAPGRFQAEVEWQKVVTTLSTATLPQLAIADFLASGGYEHHLRKVRRIYAQNAALLAQGVIRYFPAGTRVTRPLGGFVVWVEMPEHVDSVELYKRALAEGITFAPGPIFSAKGEYRNYLRLNAERWSERIERAIATLGRLAGA